MLSYEKPTYIFRRYLLNLLDISLTYEQREMILEKVERILSTRFGSIQFTIDKDDKCPENIKQFLEQNWRKWV